MCLSNNTKHNATSLLVSELQLRKLDYQLTVETYSSNAFVGKTDTTTLIYFFGNQTNNNSTHTELPTRLLSPPDLHTFSTGGHFYFELRKITNVILEITVKFGHF